jgi:hypothetical protein
LQTGSFAWFRVHAKGAIQTADALFDSQQPKAAEASGWESPAIVLDADDEAVGLAIESYPRIPGA